MQFKYGPVDIAYLKDRDPVLGAVIDRIGRIEREMQPDLWTALVHSLVSQQISKAAAATVWRRLGGLLVDLTPERLAGVALVDLQACGIPRRKAEWIQHLSHQVLSGDLDLSTLPALPDAAVIQTLSALPGIGVWTAEMLLIFALGRPDVVSHGGQAIRRGMRRLYGLETLNGYFCPTPRKGKTSPAPCFVRCVTSYRKRKSGHRLVRKGTVSVMRRWGCTKVS